MTPGSCPAAAERSVRAVRAPRGQGSRAATAASQRPAHASHPRSRSRPLPAANAEVVPVSLADRSHAPERGSDRHLTLPVSKRPKAFPDLPLYLDELRGAVEAFAPGQAGVHQVDVLLHAAAGDGLSCLVAVAA